MTNNTIPNVPRELLERARAAVASTNTSNWSSDLLRDIHAILSAPSPAGVDGLEVVAWVTTGFSGKSRTRRAFTVNADDAARQHTHWTPHYRQVNTDQLCRLSDATAIIGGLRGDLAVALKVPSVAAMRAYLDTECAKDNMRLGTELDQHAQRIGELERALLEVAASLAWNAHGECRAIHDGPIMPSQMAIDAAKAALSAGKE